MAAVMATIKSSLLPEGFETGDIVVWLRRFESCAAANGWKDDDNIKKLPAFLHGRATTHFYSPSAGDQAE